MNDRRNHNDMSIEDILESIRNVINGKPRVGDPQEDADELHLVNIKEEKTEDEADEADELPPEEDNYDNVILSSETSNRTKAILEDFVETALSLGHNITHTTQEATNTKSIESFLENMLRPQLKEWLDENLPVVVKQAVTDEIKKLVANMNKN